ncbi:hypothetical protein Tco_1363718 [Tanacetum coccineum]
MPKDPYVEATLQAPPSPDYVPCPEEPEQAPPSPVYIPGPEHADDEISNPEADPEEDDNEDPEEDPVDYPADGGDDRDDEDEPSEEDEDDDVDIEVDEDEEEEQHPAPADSVVIPSPPLPPIPSPSLPVLPPLPVSSPVLMLFPSPPLSPIRSLGYRAAMIWLRAKAASTSHFIPLPPPFILSPTRSDAPSSEIPPPLPISVPTSSPPLLLPSASRREDRPEVTLPPQKRLGIALGPRYEVGESSFAASARLAGGLRADYDFVATIDREIKRDPERDVGYGIIDS